MIAVLGLSAYYHDAAAALVVDGRVVAAAQEERFTRRKHDPAFPSHAVASCLASAGLSPADVDFVAFHEKPLRRFERIVETAVAFAPSGFRSFAAAMPGWLRDKLRMPRSIASSLPGYRRRVLFLEHHVSHAASAFFPSPFEDAAILTLDGVGEWATATLGHGRGGRVELTHEQRFPHSAGLLYTAFTTAAGFRANSGEHKLMGLAPYGEPRFVPLILERLVDLKEDGSLRLDLSYFDFCRGLRMTSPRFDRLFGPPRRPEDPITQRELDLAASIQCVVEEVVLRSARHLHARTGARRLCLAGGVALNAVANGRLAREGPFEAIWIQPAAGDAGGALGAALFVWHQLLGNPRAPGGRSAQGGTLLGPRFGAEAVRAELARRGVPHRTFSDDERLCDEVARLLAGGKVVGWFEGAMEFGPRALGARSILADPRRADMQQVLNAKIKYRESFRPFAPAVLAARAAEWFEVPPAAASPYMLVVAPVRGARRVAPGGLAAGLEALRSARSRIPAVTHLDGSARLQVVGPEANPRFRRLLERFETLTGCPVLVNTSFNVRGEPIVCTPEDAYRCFLATGMDALVLEQALLVKEAQPSTAGAAEAHRARFAPD